MLGGVHFRNRHIALLFWVSEAQGMILTNHKWN